MLHVVDARDVDREQFIERARRRELLAAGTQSEERFRVPPTPFDCAAHVVERAAVEPDRAVPVVFAPLAQAVAIIAKRASAARCHNFRDFRPRCSDSSHAKTGRRLGSELDLDHAATRGVEAQESPDLAVQGEGLVKALAAQLSARGLPLRDELVAIDLQVDLGRRHTKVERSSLASREPNGAQLERLEAERLLDHADEDGVTETSHGCHRAWSDRDPSDRGS
ncbi:MAG TPA: hypothetical protein VGN51_13855 [Acidimicrobiia bacterium]